MRAVAADRDATLAVLGDMCRANALTAVKRAGSGHLGSSFSALDLVVHLLFEELNVAELGWDHPDRDVFFSSKGHDVPGLYAALARARRDPHRAPAAPAPPRRPRRPSRRRRAGDRGQLGLARDGHLQGPRHGLGEALPRPRGARRRDGRRRRAPGGPELRGAAGDRRTSASGDLWVIVDRNELQSDKPTEEIIALGDLEAKLAAFGWHVESCDGHDHAALRDVFGRFRLDDERPKVLIARTIKGKGVSFMEHPARSGAGRWHVPLACRSARRRGLRPGSCRARRAHRRTPGRSRCLASPARARAAARRRSCSFAAGRAGVRCRRTGASHAG